MTLDDAQPQVHVIARLPPIISFSSVEEPELELQFTLQYEQPIVIAPKYSRLWPLHLRSALKIDHAGTEDNMNIFARIDSCSKDPSIPRITQDTRADFSTLQPGVSHVEQISFRPKKKPSNYEELKHDDYERFSMIFPPGMQFLKPGDEYELRIEEPVQPLQCIIGELKSILSAAEDGAEWKFMETTAEVVVGPRCKFRVES